MYNSCCIGKVVIAHLKLYRFSRIWLHHFYLQPRSATDRYPSFTGYPCAVHHKSTVSPFKFFCDHRPFFLKWLKKNSQYGHNVWTYRVMHTRVSSFNTMGQMTKTSHWPKSKCISKRKQVLVIWAPLSILWLKLRQNYLMLIWPQYRFFFLEDECVWLIYSFTIFFIFPGTKAWQCTCQIYFWNLKQIARALPSFSFHNMSATGITATTNDGSSAPISKTEVAIDQHGQQHTSVEDDDCNNDDTESLDSNSSKKVLNKLVAFVFDYLWLAN